LISAASTPVISDARSSVYGSTVAMYSSKCSVALATNASFTSPAWMISRPMALARAMSVPTSRPSQASAHCAVEVRRGSTEYMRAPLFNPCSTWWKKIGWVSRALEPQRISRSACSASS
jgi:hypothetical protein